MKPQSRKILIVDDESAIRRTLEAIFRDEGFDVASAPDGESGLKLVREFVPDLVLLDIWLPGRDGLEILEQIKRESPQVAVVMISGHGTIQSALKATRLGAAEFIEKPLDLALTLEVVNRVLAREEFPRAAGTEGAAREGGESTLQVGSAPEVKELNRIVFAEQSCRGRAFPQRTLARSAVLYGQGLHSGQKSGLVLEPLQPNSGIHFIGVPEATAVPAHVDFVESTGFATTIKFGRTQTGTIEHLMSALHAYGISNLLVKCNGEVPVMDGSALKFCELFDEVGVEQQSEPWYEIELKEPIVVGSGNEQLVLEPAEEFTIEYTLNYPAPVGRQHRVYTLDSVESYKREIAPARTFGFVKDVGMLQRSGLALGGRFDNFVLFGDEGPINDKLRFPDEPVRHKILDAIGDLFLLGRRLRCKVVASMTGHSDNIAALKQLRSKLLLK